MFVEIVTNEQKEYAKRIVAYSNLGKRGKADGNKSEQLTGVIGQTVAADLLGLPRPVGGEGFDGGVDFVINNKRVDVKTMTRTTDMKMDYVHNFIGYQKSYIVDYYIFLSYNKEKDEITFCGCIDKKSFFDKADFFREGAKRYRNDGTYFFSKAPLYEIKQHQLVQVKDKNDLIKGIK